MSTFERPSSQKTWRTLTRHGSPVARYGPMLLLVVICLVTMPGRTGAQELDEVVEWVGTLELDETPEALVAEPHLRRDPHGGWIYWDPQESQVRLYSDEGELEEIIGRAGDGPGEFRGLVGADRLGDGGLVTLDGRGRLAHWSETGDSLRAGFDLDVRRPIGLASADGDRVVVGSMPRMTEPEGPMTPALHLVDVSEEGVVGSFLRLSPPRSHRTAMMQVQGSSPVVRGDTAYLAFAPIDSLWAVSLPDGREVGAVALDAGRLRDTPEPVHASEGRRAFREWVGEAWFVGTLVPFRDGGWLVELWNRPADADATSYALLRVDGNGDPLLEVETDHRLLGADPDRGRLYFWDPGGLQPNRIRIAEIRQR